MEFIATGIAGMIGVLLTIGTHNRNAKMAGGIILILCVIALLCFLTTIPPTRP